MAAKSGAPQNVGQGLSRVGEALLHNSMVSRSEAGAAEGAAEREAIMSALMGNPDPGMSDIASALGNEWVTSDPGSSAIVQALLGQELQQNDPLRQLQIEKLGLEVDGIRNPPEPGPEYDFVFGPNGELIRTDKTSGGIDALGNFADAPEPGFELLSPEQAAANNLDPNKSWQIGPDGRVYEVGNSGVNVTNNLGGGKFDEVFATEDAKALGEISTAGIAAQRNLGRIDQLESLLSQSPTGFGASLAQMAGEIGINTEGLSEIQAAQALINSLVPEQRQPGSGPMSDADLNLFKQSLPRIINQPGGNALIINTMRAIAQYDAEGATIVQQLRAGDITRAEAFDMLQSRQNPLETFKAVAGDDTPEASSQSGQSQANPQIFSGGGAAPAQSDGVVDFSDYFR
ncbi:MAG: hypothetical protein RLW68_00795 [Devosia marina]